MDRQSYEVGKRGRLWLPAVEGTIERGDRDRTLTLHRGVAHLELRGRLCNGTGGKDLRIRKLRVETDWAAMDDSRGSGKAIDIMGPKPIGAHAKAAHVKIVVNTPGAPTKVSIMVMKVGDRKAVEVGEVVVDPLLPCLIISGKVSRQPLHRIKEARRAHLGVQRGVAHRSARR